MHGAGRVKAENSASFLHVLFACSKAKFISGTKDRESFFCIDFFSMVGVHWLI